MDAKTKLVALIGNPVGHSLSPKMHNAVFSATGLNYAYLAFRVVDVKKAIDGVRALGFAGLNVTIPHKIEVMKHIDKVDSLAGKIGAVNVIVNKNGRLVGYNTDCFGAIRCLEKRTKLKGKKIALIGCGGAGRAIAFGLKEKRAKVFLVDRNEQKAKALAKKVKGKEIKRNELAGFKFDILINATPSGMSPKINEMAVDKKVLKKGLIVFDIVYKPVETKLLKEAKKRGCRTINGLEMLLEQGIASFELWTGKKAQRKVMEKALIKALKVRK